MPWPPALLKHKSGLGGNPDPAFSDSKSLRYAVGNSVAGFGGCLSDDRQRKSTRVVSDVNRTGAYLPPPYLNASERSAEDRERDDGCEKSGGGGSFATVWRSNGKRAPGAAGGGDGNGTCPPAMAAPPLLCDVGGGGRACLPLARACALALVPWEASDGARTRGVWYSGGRWRWA